MATLIEPELSYLITGHCFKIQKKIGRFAKEKQYCDDFELSIRENGLNYKREYEIKNLNPNSPAGNKVDFWVEGILVDFKAKPFITKEDYFQMQRYLEAADIKLGLIVNFRNFYLKPKRVINPKYDKNHS